MVDYLVNFNHSATTVYNEVIRRIQCYILFTFLLFVSNTEKRKYCKHLCYNTNVDLFLL